MKIPNQTKLPRYYIALSSDEACSSWDSYEEAVDCIERFRSYKLLDMLDKIKGIIKSEPSGSKWVKIL